jgi:uncharacterized membrane protein
MSPGAWELLDLVARWTHVIAGIMWVGNSLLFNWLDRNLDSRAEHYGGSGAIWLLHSGGFYYVEKTLLPGQKLPVPLHWFKWQAYTTWLSGFALLIAVYWVGGRAATIKTVPPGLFTAIVGIGVIAVGTMIYEACNRWIASRAPRLSLVLWMGSLLAISWLLVVNFDGRAAFLHVGAMLGTIMAANVAHTIIPSQRQLVKAVEEGKQAAAVADSARAKRVSIHNNYFTFPVIALMLSGHFPSLYGGPNAWAILLVLVAGGAAVRHVLNVRYTVRSWQPLLAATMIATIVPIYLMSRQQQPFSSSDLEKIEPSFANVRHVIDRRCAACHSTTPTDLTFGPAPAGVAFDTPEQIGTYANRINERAVITRTMPPANKTGLTDAERDLLGRWFLSGAPIR